MQPGMIGLGAWAFGGLQLWKQPPEEADVSTGTYDVIVIGAGSAVAVGNIGGGPERYWTFRSLLRMVPKPHLVSSFT
jgi:hypothetical protein